MMKSEDCTNKVVLIDWNIFVFPAIFVYIKNREIAPTWTTLNMMFSSLKRIGLNEGDTIIVAVDGKGNWRKEIDENYKADRREKRLKFDFDWDLWFKKYDDISCKLDISTPFHIVKIPRMEADDIISYSCRHYKDKECVIVSFDSDFEQLCYFENVKLYSPKLKIKGGKGGYKIVKNPLGVLSKKTQTERADNLITPAVTKEEIDKRRKIVNLIELPDFVDKAIESEINIIDEIEEAGGKGEDLRKLPFESIKKKYIAAYHSDNIITYSDSLENIQKKKVEKKKKDNKIIQNTFQY